MTWDPASVVAAVFVLCSFALCGYLLAVFRRVEAELEAVRRAQPAAEELAATRALIEQVAGEIARIAGEIADDREEAEAARRSTAEWRLALAGRIDALEAARQAAVSAEPPKPEAAVSEPPAPKPARALPFGERGRKVRALYEQGRSLGEISREVALSGGEVELILGLDRRLNEIGEG